MSRVGTGNESQRDAWVRARLAELPANWQILDAGAGQQRYRDCCSHLQYVAQDFAQYRPGVDGAGLHSNWDYRGIDLVCDITSIPQPQASFDAILCTEVFEHLPDPLAAIREFARLLRPGGKLLITAPFISLTHFAPYHFATGFNRYFYQTHLSAHGFEINDLTCSGNYFELIAQEVRRIASVAEKFSAGKPGRWERFAIRTVLRMLERFSQRGDSSSELGCYGLHVVATRLSNTAQVAA